MSAESGATMLKEVITQRYAGEAESCCNLSCGGALESAQLQPGEVVVDLGSGRGTDVLKAARSVGSQGFAYGVDFTPKMIQAAESNRAKLRIQNARFLEGELEKLPIEDGLADAVISNCTINHARDKAAVYREIFRVLKSGGRAVVSDVIAEVELPESVKNDPEAWAGCYGGAIVKEDYYQAIARSGFAQVELLEESKPYEKGGVMVKSITIKLKKP